MSDLLVASRPRALSYPARLEHLCSRFKPHALQLRMETQSQAAFAASTPIESGGAERDRTVDPLLAKQVLSQLSYSPLPEL